MQADFKGELEHIHFNVVTGKLDQGKFLIEEIANYFPYKKTRITYEIGVVKKVP